MSTYHPCPGTGQPARNVRRSTSGGKFYGKTYGQCPTCGKGVKLPASTDCQFPTPRHIEAAEVTA